MHNSKKIPYKYLVNTLSNLKKNFCPSFSGIFTQQERENAIKKEIGIKHRMFEATNLRQSRESYTTAGCDG